MTRLLQIVTFILRISKHKRTYFYSIFFFFLMILISYGDNNIYYFDTDFMRFEFPNFYNDILAEIYL